MIYFEDWRLRTDGEIVARQFDHLTRSLVVKGDIPSDWEWIMLVQVGDAMDVLPLAPIQEGLGIVLTAKQLSLSGYYAMQLKAVRGELVRHTNTIHVYIPESLTGDEQWPDVPSEFTDLERRLNEKAAEARSYSSYPPIIGENETWMIWDGLQYVNSGKPTRGAQGAKGEQGIRGEKGDNSVVVAAVVNGEILRLSENGSSEFVTTIENNVLYVNKGGSL